MSCSCRPASRAWSSSKRTSRIRQKSQVFSKYPKFLANHHAVHFVCDTLRMSISGGVPAFDLDQMMEMDMEVHHHEARQPVSRA